MDGLHGAAFEGFDGLRFERITRRRRPLSERPRIAGRIVPPLSFALLLDWSLSASERLCLEFLIGCPREGLRVHDQSRAGIARQFGVVPSTAGDWLINLESHGHIHRLPGKRRGLITILLAPHVLRWLRYGPGDFTLRGKKKSKQNQRFDSRPRVESLPLKATESKQRRSEQAVDNSAPSEDATPPAPAPDRPIVVRPFCPHEAYRAERQRWKAEREAKAALARRFRPPI